MAHRISIILTNLIAIIFLGFVFLANPSIKGEVSIEIAEQKILKGLIVYGLVVSVVFTIISVILSFLYKKVSFKNKFAVIKKIFYQFLFLITVFLLFLSLIYFK